MYGLFTRRDYSIAQTILRTGMLGGLMALGADAWAGDDIQFNTDVLDLNDRTNVDLSQFSRSGFILPGVYPMQVQINTQLMSEQRIAFYPPDDDPRGSQACLTPELVAQLGLKRARQAELAWWKGGECLDTNSLAGMAVSGDLGTSTLHISVPQAYLEYSAQNWDPPSRWDNGVPGVLMDYNLTAKSASQQGAGRRTELSGNGTFGANAGPWRFRADWQGRIDDERYSRAQRLEWSRFYAYRALPSIQARLTLGENYLYSNVFDSFRFTGLALNSDDNQLPPNLRGYAPEVVGVARTNAKVIISQQGRVLYEALVAAGPFRIQDLNDAVTGTLDVRVEEQDGSVTTFQVESANIPYLTRPGTVRYKLATGRPSSLQHGGQGDIFGTAEFSWGVSNGWSLYGGGLSDNNYTALSIGAGRDLLAFGAMSFDVSRASATVQNKSLSGDSFRLSYSKNFDQYDSQVTFAGYRFSQKNYMSMNEYLSARHYGGPVGGSKSIYTGTFNKQFRDLGLTAYLSYSNQSYWDRPTSERWNLSLARYFSVGSVRNMSLSMNLFRNQEKNQHSGISSDNTGMYLSVSLPLGRSGTLNSSVNSSQGKNSYSTTYSDRLDQRNSYQLGASDTSVSGYLNHAGDQADITVSAALQENSYNSLSLSARGGGTLTPYGAAGHRTAGTGGTRLMIDTSGVPDVPIRGYGSPTRSNVFGKAVVADVASFMRTGASVDLESLPTHVEATQSMTQLTLTEGAIGYRTLDVIAGLKAMAVLSLPDGSFPPFGATVKNQKQQGTGIVNDAGNVYLSGIQPGGQMVVSWGGSERCAFVLPENLPVDGLSSTLSLSCQMVSADKSVPASASLTGIIDTEKQS